MLGLVLSENRKNSFPKKKHLSVLIAKISSHETQQITNSVPHGNNNNKNIKICAHTGQHGILGLGTSRSPRMSAPFIPHSRFVLNYYQRKQESLFFLPTISLILNTVVSIWVQDPPRPRSLYIIRKMKRVSVLREPLCRRGSH